MSRFLACRPCGAAHRTGRSARVRGLPLWLLLLTLVLSACAPLAREASVAVACDDFLQLQTAPGTPKVIEQRLTLQVKETLQLRLCSNPATGFRWEEPIIGDPVVLQFQTRRFEEATTPRPGAPGIEVLTFTALSAGQSTVSLDYSQPWAGGAKGEWQFRLTVVVT